MAQLEVKVAKTTQSAIPELGKPEKTMYYLAIGEGEDIVTINTGETNYEKVKALTEKLSNKLTDTKGVTK